METTRMLDIVVLTLASLGAVLRETNVAFE